MTNSFHDVDLDLSKNALEDEDMEEALEEGLDEEDLEDEFDEDEGAMLSESQLAGILSGDDLSGDIEDDWDEEEFGEF